MKNFKVLIILLILFSCSSEVKELNEIKKLTKINYPDQSKIIYYNDDLVGLLVFELEIDFSENKDFITKNNFTKINESMYLHTDFSNDELSIKQMNHHFKDKILIHEGIMILNDQNYILIVDKEVNKLWGYLNY